MKNKVWCCHRCQEIYILRSDKRQPKCCKCGRKMAQT